MPITNHLEISGNPEEKRKFFSFISFFIHFAFLLPLSELKTGRTLSSGFFLLPESWVVFIKLLL